MKIPKGLTHVEYLRIRLEAAIPSLRLFEQEYGKDAVHTLLNKELNKRISSSLASKVIEPDLNKEITKLESYLAEDALEYKIIKHDADGLEFNVTRCAYVDLLKELDAIDLGYLLVCAHDFPEAIEDGMILTRTKTCMQGDGVCDFKYRKRNKP